MLAMAPADTCEWQSTKLGMTVFPFPSVSVRAAGGISSSLPIALNFPSVMATQPLSGFGREPAHTMILVITRSVIKIQGSGAKLFRLELIVRHNRAERLDW